MFARRCLVVGIVTIASLWSTVPAQAWHRHFLGAYGVNFYSPAAYVYSAPRFYSGYTWGGFYRPWRPLHTLHAWRPLHHGFVRPYVAYRPVITSYYYDVSPIHYTTPIYYSAPINYCPPISYQQPVTTYLDDCSTCFGSTTTVETSTLDATYPVESSVDPQLQIRHQPQSKFQVAQQEDWIEIAIKMIDEMAVQGGFAEAEQACTHLIAVRGEVSADVHLRAGLLALKNGKASSEIAAHFESAQKTMPIQAAVNSLSTEFVAALDLKNFGSIESHVQDASKALLATKSTPTTKVRLASELETEVTVLKPAPIVPDAQAALLLDTLLRVNGQSDKADALAEAMNRLPTL